MSGGTKASTKNCFVESMTPEASTASGADLSRMAALSRKCYRERRGQLDDLYATNREAYPIGENHDATAREDLGCRWMSENAFHDSGVELHDALRKIVKALELVGLGSRLELAKRLEFGLSLQRRRGSDHARHAARKSWTHLGDLLLVLGK